MGGDGRRKETVFRQVVVCLCLLLLTFDSVKGQAKRMPHFKLNSIETIGRSLENTIFVDTIGKVNFSLTNSGFTPGPKIYLDKRLLQDSTQVKRLYMTLRKMLINFYIEKFGIILAYHMSQIEEIKSIGIDLGGNFKLINHRRAPSKKKASKLNSKLIKKSNFSKSSNVLEEAGIILNEQADQNVDELGEKPTKVNAEPSFNQARHFKAAGVNYPLSFLNLKNSNFATSSCSKIFGVRRNIQKLHVVTSKVNKQIAFCRCKTTHVLHSRLIMLSQSLLFIINGSIDTVNMPWYSMPDFISLLLEDIMRISSIMRFIGPTFSRFKSIKEYYKYSKKHISRAQKKHYLKFFSDRRNNYQTKFLLQILGVAVSFFANIFHHLVEEFRESHTVAGLATQIEVSSAVDYRENEAKNRLFSKQDLILVNEYIDKLQNQDNCILYQKSENNMSFNMLNPKSVFSLC